MKLTFTLRVTDTFDNWKEISIVVVYDAGTTDDGGFVSDLINSDNEGWLLPLIIAFVVLVIAVIIITMVKKVANRKTDDKPKRKIKKQIKLPDFPAKGLESLSLESGEKKIITDFIIKIKNIMNKSDHSDLINSLQFEVNLLRVSEFGKQALSDINAVINPWMQEVKKKGGFT